MSTRPPVDRQRIVLFLQHLGDRFRHPGRVYLVGGTTMVFEGFRRQEILSHCRPATASDVALSKGMVSSTCFTLICTALR